MSLPLTRRIAKAALLTAAGAATVVGAAGAATAAQQSAGHLGGLNLDTPVANGPLDNTTSSATGLTSRATGDLMPTGNDLLGETAKVSQGGPAAGLPL